MVQKLDVLKADLSEARKDLNYLQKSYPKSRDLILSRQDKVAKLQREIKSLTEKLQGR